MPMDLILAGGIVIGAGIVATGGVGVLLKVMGFRRKEKTPPS